jgi:hypothetical protein
MRGHFTGNRRVKSYRPSIPEVKDIFTRRWRPVTNTASLRQEQGTEQKRQ